MGWKLEVAASMEGHFTTMLGEGLGERWRC